MIMIWFFSCKSWLVLWILPICKYSAGVPKELAFRDPLFTLLGFAESIRPIFYKDIWRKREKLICWSTWLKWWGREERETKWPFVKKRKKEMTRNVFYNWTKMKIRENILGRKNPMFLKNWDLLWCSMRARKTQSHRVYQEYTGRSTYVGM